jgi:hypothetical protein
VNLIELALTTYTEGSAAKTEETAALAEEARVEFLAAADSCAHGVLNSGADDLNWQYTTTGLPESVEEARAILAPGRPEYLRYRIDHADETADVSFDLVQPCSACGDDRITAVTGLYRLGQILHDTQQPFAEEDQAPEEEAGPLTAVNALQARAADLTRLARRLHAEHTNVGLAIARTSLFGHDDGGTAATLYLAAADVASARTVAAALGTDLTTKTVDHTGTYPYVIEHAQATTTIDGVQVELTAFTKLPDDEAAAWRAQQNQSSEDESPAGGEGE